MITKKIKLKFKYIVLLIILLSFNMGVAQPVYSSKIILDGISIYRDQIDSSIYYYEPGEIHLARNADGQPSLKYLKMFRSKLRNENKTVTDNFNIIQLKLKIRKLTQEQLEELIVKLNLKGTELVPISIKKFEFNLLTGISSVGQNKILGTHLEASYENLKSNLWDEKTVTIQLSKEAAQILDDSLDKLNKLELEFSYNYFADFHSNIDQIRNTKNLEIKKLEDNFTEEINFKSGEVDLGFNIDLWKDKCVKEIVLNEELLPRYHPIKLVCYDFSEEFRPDLLVKKVTVCGQGLGFKETCTRDLEFNTKDSQLNAISVKFKQPILFSKPLKYRVTEIDLRGNILKKDWEEVSFEKVIDVTSYKLLHSLKNRTITVWLNQDDFLDTDFKKSELSIRYTLKGQPITKKINIEPTKQALFVTSIFSDNNTPINYSLVWKGNNKQILKSIPSRQLKNDIIKITL